MVSLRALNIAGLAAILTAGVLATPARGALLTPGGTLFPAPGEPDPIGGTVLQSLTVPFIAVDFTGILTSRVIQGDTTNTLGGLTFTYQVSNTDTDASPTDINRVTVTNYTGFLTDVSFQVGSGLSPTLVDRGLPPAGLEVGFGFENVIGQGAVRPGQTSALLVVQTNAPLWVPTFASVIDGGVASVASLGPAVPEPTSLVGLALGGVALLHRRRK
jgi:hypothetical protein